MSQRDLKILTAIGEGHNFTQRGLAGTLGIALGLTNLYLKRLARKGYIKITTIPQNRLHYFLTPKGLARKSRLTYEYMAFSLHLYRQVRENLRKALEGPRLRESQRIALYGTGEAAEVAYLTLKEMGIEPVAVYGNGPSAFLGFKVSSPDDFDVGQIDRLVVASFEPLPAHEVAALRRTLGDERLVFLSPVRR